jgi:hypothetical protein
MNYEAPDIEVGCRVPLDGTGTEKFTHYPELAVDQEPEWIRS